LEGSAQKVRFGRHPSFAVFADEGSVFAVNREKADPSPVQTANGRGMTFLGDAGFGGDRGDS
jgi:hypothetical protein